MLNFIKSQKKQKKLVVKEQACTKKEQETFTSHIDIVRETTILQINHRY